MSETKQIDVRALASLTDGRLLVPHGDDGGFATVHAAADWLLGGFIWSQHFADPAMCERLSRLALEQFPDLPKDGQFADFRDAARACVEHYGPMHQNYRNKS